jgi:hypothetical protein
LIFFDDMFDRIHEINETLVKYIPNKHITWAYNNQTHHAPINWRLALDMARLASEQNAKFDFSQDYYWENHISGIADRISKKINGKKIKISTTYAIQAEDKTILITHPLWNENIISGITSKLQGIVEPMQIQEVVRRSHF